MRKAVRRTALGAATLAAAVGVALAVSPAASAETTHDYGYNAAVDQDTTSGFGTAYVQWYDANGNIMQYDDKALPAYARGGFSNYESGYSMKGWLERSTNGGKTYSVVSGYHYLNDGGVITDQLTDPYYDGPGYLARACFQFTSWSGAAVHCSPGI